MATGIGENEQGLPEDAPRAWRRWSRRAQNIATIGWSSFLAACLATGLFFAQVDPLDIQLVVTSLRDISAEAGYAIGFFFFWFVCAVSSLLAVFLIRTSRRRNGRPRAPSSRSGK
jgi:hypothetical protein